MTGRTVMMPCFNPECDQNVTMTVEQKRAFLITWALKYDATVLPTCSPECAETLREYIGDSYEEIARHARDAVEKMRNAR